MSLIKIAVLYSHLQGSLKFTPPFPTKSKSPSKNNYQDKTLTVQAPTPLSRDLDRTLEHSNDRQETIVP